MGVGDVSSFANLNTFTTSFVSSISLNGGHGVYRVWAKVSDDGTNLKTWVSMNGGSWQLRLSQFRTTVFAGGATEIGVGFWTFNATGASLRIISTIDHWQFV